MFDVLPKHTSFFYVSQFMKYLEENRINWKDFGLISHIPEHKYDNPPAFVVRANRTLKTLAINLLIDDINKMCEGMMAHDDPKAEHIIDDAESGWIGWLSRGIYKLFSKEPERENVEEAKVLFKHDMKIGLLLLGVRVFIMACFVQFSCSDMKVNVKEQLAKIENWVVEKCAIFPSVISHLRLFSYMWSSGKPQMERIREYDRFVIFSVRTPHELYLDLCEKKPVDSRLYQAQTMAGELESKAPSDDDQGLGSRVP